LLNQKGNDLALYGILLVILYLDPNVRSLFEVRTLQSVVANQNVCVSTPKVHKEKEGVNGYYCHEAEHWHQLFSIEYFSSKLPVDPKGCEE